MRRGWVLVALLALFSSSPNMRMILNHAFVLSSPTTTTTTVPSWKQRNNRKASPQLQHSSSMLSSQLNTNHGSDNDSTVAVQTQTATEDLQEEQVVVSDKVVSPLSSSNDSKLKQPHFLQKIDGIVFVTYLCNILALSLPVVLVPLAATEQFAATTVGVSNQSKHIAATVAAISSVATLGGAVGKLVNGFICQHFGSYRSSRCIYWVWQSAVRSFHCRPIQRKWEWRMRAWNFVPPYNGHRSPSCYPIITRRMPFN